LKEFRSDNLPVLSWSSCFLLGFFQIIGVNKALASVNRSLKKKKSFAGSLLGGTERKIKPTLLKQQERSLTISPLANY